MTFHHVPVIQQYEMSQVPSYAHDSFLPFARQQRESRLVHA